MTTAPSGPTLEFTVVRIDGASPRSVKPTSDILPRSPCVAGLYRVLQQPVVIVVCALLYLASMLWYVVTASRLPLATPSEPSSMWVVCIPYTAFMVHKLLTAVRAMEATEYAPDQDDFRDYDDDDASVEFGDSASHDAIAVVGDVCIYVIGILILCYYLLPRQLTVE